VAVMRRSVATLVLAAAATSSALTLPASARIVTPLPTATPAPLLLASSTPSVPAPSASGAAVAWGVCGFLGILASAIKRLAPIALQPLLQRDLSWLQWGCYGGAMGFFAYVEGYGAFQKKFSPMVVERAMTLKQGASPMNVALAPFYSMGLMHATKKRKIVSWSVSLSVAMIVGIVKRLPYPWRSIVDAGVVTGLTWGAASIMAFYTRALLGTPPGVDPQLPPSS